ncbi:MAG: cysteine synthase family protein [Dehalococcoidia bacterium]|nr:cysteine synthase family protein [Dehalococcoidia bacterium]
MRAKDIIDAIGNTPLVEMPCLTPKPEVHIFAKLEGHNPTGSVKDRIAKYMIEGAEASGELTPGRVILESTSGNTGIALAMIGRRKGYEVTVVMPENVSVERRQLLELYGAKVILSDGTKGSNGAIEVAREMAAKDRRYYAPYQYGNPANPLAHYETTGAEIVRDLPEVDVFIAGMGTGGTLMGVGKRLKEHNPRVKIIAVEPHPGELVQGLRSLADGFIPEIIDLSLLDGKMVVDSKDAFAMTKQLTLQEGIFAGISAGAAVHCALRTARRMAKGNIVVLLADGGWKYLSTGLWTHEYEEMKEQIGSKIWW